jgi:hypothetical protein
MAEAAGAALFVCGKYAGKTGHKMWRIPRIFVRFLGIWTGIFFLVLFLQIQSQTAACHQEIIETQLYRVT